MRILLINYEYPPVGGGAANATWEIARAMVKLGHEAVVLTARYKHRQPDTDNPKIKVIEVPAIRRRKDRCSIFEMTTFVISATLRIRGILRREKIEGMIAFFSIPCGPIAWWGWRATKTPYIVSLRGGDVPGNELSLASIHRLLRPLRRTVVRHARAIVANSPGLKAAAETVDPFPVEVIPNGVDTDFWHPPEERPPPPPFRFLFVGRFQTQKNLQWLFYKFAELASDSTMPPWQLHLVGDGPQRRQLELESHRLGLVSRIRWHGWLPRPQLRELYGHVHAVVNPSLYEGMPNVVLEAMSSGLPVLATRIAGNDAIVIPNETGQLFSLNSGDEFTRHAREWVMRPADPVQFGHAARSRVLSAYTWPDTAEAYLAAVLAGPDIVDPPSRPRVLSAETRFNTTASIIDRIVGRKSD
jgi:glycosyltransferase involved in cell wall biosynthesis